MKRTVSCKRSKKGNLYLSSEKEGKLTLVRLVKDNKRYNPDLVEGQTYEIEFTSYDLDSEKRIVTLFNVTGI